MSDLFWLSDELMARLEPFFPMSHGKPRVDDRRVLSGIIFINRNGLRWRDAPKEYGPQKDTLQSPEAVEVSGCTPLVQVSPRTGHLRRDANWLGR